MQEIKRAAEQQLSSKKASGLWAFCLMVVNGFVLFCRVLSLVEKIYALWNKFFGS